MLNGYWNIRFHWPFFYTIDSIFYTAIEKSREKHQLQLQNLEKIIQAKMAESKDFAKEIEQGQLLHRQKIAQNKRELNLLNPKRQVSRLFRNLFSAILFILFYYFQHSHFWTFDCQSFIFNCQQIKMASVTLSVICFLYCLRVLWQIFCTIIQIKSEEEKAKPSRNVPLKPQKGA